MSIELRALTPSPLTTETATACASETSTTERSNLFATNFFRRVHPEGQRTIAAGIQGRHVSASDIQSLNGCNFSQDPFFTQKEWIFVAIKAYAIGKLTDAKLALLVLYDACKDLPGFRCYTPKSSPTWDEILNQGFSRVPWLQMDRAIQALKTTLSEAEQVVFSYQSSKDEKDPSMDHLFFTEMFKHTPFVPILGDPKKPEKWEILILPPTLFQKLLENRFGPQTVCPDPVLGYDQNENLARLDKRVMSIQHRLFARANSVHSFICSLEGQATYVHDMAHLSIESSIPLSCRMAMIDIALFLKNLGEKSPQEYAPSLLRFFQSRCLDKNFYRHLQNTSRPPTSQGILEAFIQKTMHDSSSLEKPEEALEQLRTTLKDYILKQKSLGNPIYTEVTPPLNF